MGHFVSASGPDLEPVKYRKSTRYYSEALRESELIQQGLDKSLTTVIYRLSYDPARDSFFSWRQINAELAGNEKAEDDKTAEALAYEIFSAPRSLLGRDDVALSRQVDLIAAHSQMHRPGPVGP